MSEGAEAASRGPEHPRTIDDILSLSPREFEELVAKLFEEMGYEVEVTKASADGGYDVVAFYQPPALPGSKLKFIIECKRWKDKKVGALELGRLVEAIVKEGADGGIFITTSGFTEQALEEAGKYIARGIRLELWDGEKLLSEITRVLDSPASPAISVPELGFPPDIIARYHRALMLYELLEVFLPSSAHAATVLSFLIRDQDPAGLVSKLCNKLASEGWAIKPHELRGRTVLLAESPGANAVVGILASITPAGPVLSLIISSGDKARLSALTSELRKGLLELCPGAEEVAS